MKKLSCLSSRCRFFAVAGSSLILAASALVAPVAQSAPISQGLTEQKVSPAEATTNSYFGTSVALRRGLALIGAPGEDSVQGAAYFYKNVEGSLYESQRVTASDGVAGDQFGHQVALEKNGAAVSAYAAAVNGYPNAGAVYFYTHTGPSWGEVQKLTSRFAQPRGGFGSALALEGEYLVVGAYGENTNGTYSQGAAYVYHRRNGVWSLQQKLTASDGAGYSIFGESVAISGGTILVGAPDTAVNGFNSQGAVYVYTLTGDTWTQTQKLTATDGQAYDNFGSAVAFDDSAAVIAAGTATVDGHSYAGKAYIFANNNGSFTQSQELLPPAPQDFGEFANAVAISNSAVMIGDYGATVGSNAGQGLVYIYGNGTDGYTLRQQLTASDGQAGDRFGQSLALVPGELLAGTEYPTIAGHTYQGAAYFYSQ